MSLKIWSSNRRSILAAPMRLATITCARIPARPNLLQRKNTQVISDVWKAVVFRNHALGGGDQIASMIQRVADMFTIGVEGTPPPRARHL